MSDFVLKIEKFAEDTEAKMLAVTKNSIQEVVRQAQEPGSIPIDTGFLRHSGVAQLNSIPSGEIRGRNRKKGDAEGPLPEYRRDDNASYVNSTLAKMTTKDKFFFGWTAEYAQERETYNGFLAKAVQNWKTIVAAQIARVKKK